MKKQGILDRILNFMGGDEEYSEKTNKLLNKYWVLALGLLILKLLTLWFFFAAIPLGAIVLLIAGFEVIPSTQLKGALESVGFLYLKIFLLLIPFRIAKYLSSGCNVKEKFIWALRWILIIACILTFMTLFGGEEGEPDPPIEDWGWWWLYHNGLVMYFSGVIAAWIGVIYGDKNKPKYKSSSYQ